MSLKDFIKSRIFLKHLMLSVLVVLIIILFTLQRLKSYTHHGESFPVPDFSGLSASEVEPLAHKYHLNVEIVDSIHFAGAKPGAVVEQVPETGMKVKKNRIVFLTINATVPEKVSLPKLTDISFRQAQGLIENCGLVLGNITYEYSEFNNLVLKVTQNSNELNIGDEVLKGSLVNLVVGQAGENIETALPDLTGLTLDEARNALSTQILNTGAIIFDQNILTTDDSLRAVVWRQYPSINNTHNVGRGTSVDLWLTSDTLQIMEPTSPEIK